LLHDVFGGSWRIASIKFLDVVGGGIFPSAITHNTWSNKRREPTLVKLDRILVNVDWIESKVYILGVRTLTRQTSDHKPVLLDMSNTMPKNKCFRYEDYWLHVEGLVTNTKER
jgi:hypothetical protein